MDPYLSSIYFFGGNFAIRGFALCAGQILALSSNTALFSLIGTYYGGNGTSSFGLPDLRGRSALCQGTGVGLSPYSLGEFIGTENTSMLYSNMPSHTHAANAAAQNGTVATPAGNFFSEVSTGSGPHQQTDYFYNAGPVNTVLAPASLTAAGGGVPFNIQQPVLAISVLIATSGLFPARN
jgi:microcystin-dependent protein